MHSFKSLQLLPVRETKITFILLQTNFQCMILEVMSTTVLSYLSKLPYIRPKFVVKIVPFLFVSCNSERKWQLQCFEMNHGHSTRNSSPSLNAQKKLEDLFKVALRV